MHKWIIPILGHPSAGKSTLIRILTNNKARIGKKPGTTRKIIDYPVNDILFLRDYPGFGRIASRSRKYTEKVEQRIIDDVELIKSDILVSIVIVDLSTVEVMAEKFSNKGIIPIDYEMADFLYEITTKKPILLGNKIDKLRDSSNYDKFLKYFPKKVDFFPVSLKQKLYLEPFLFHLQNICNGIIGEDINDVFYKFD